MGGEEWILCSVVQQIMEEHMDFARMERVKEYVGTSILVKGSEATIAVG